MFSQNLLVKFHTTSWLVDLLSEIDFCNGLFGMGKREGRKWVEGRRQNHLSLPCGPTDSSPYKSGWIGEEKMEFWQDDFLIL